MKVFSAQNKDIINFNTNIVRLEPQSVLLYNLSYTYFNTNIVRLERDGFNFVLVGNKVFQY